LWVTTVEAARGGAQPSVIEGTGEPRMFVLPVDSATLVDNWDVLGFATGSIDYRMENVFVPEAYTHFAVAGARS
jgi:hypothetical protein